MEKLDGTLSRVMFHAPSKYDAAGAKYLIARTAAGQTIKGSMDRPVIGAQYRFWGEFKPQSGRDETAFVFESYDPVIDESSTGAETLLRDHIDGIGRAKAAAIAEHFGDETLAILRETPERAREVRGISDAIVDAIRTYFEKARFDPAAYARLVDMFNKSGHRISKKVLNALIKDFRSNAPDKVIANPYILLTYPGVGWPTADSFAMATAGYDPDGIKRHCAAILEAFEPIIREGHTFATKVEIRAGVVKLINRMPRPDAWDRLIAEGEITGDGERFSITKIWVAEDAIATTLASLHRAAKPLPFALDTGGLASDQVDAIRTIEASGVCLLVGPPGTGKSYTIARAIKGLIDGGITGIRVTAPTGKAAKRAAELLVGAGIDPDAIPCTTIHRALAPTPTALSPGVPQESAKSGRGRDKFEFARGPGSPLDESVIVVDETSMVDVSLMRSLLSAIKPGSRVIFVGDENQLPSVGPGSTLRDMLTSGIPVAELRDIKRSDGGGRVVRACHAIKDGRSPAPAQALDLPTENWIHIEANDPAEIASTIVSLYDRFGKFDPTWDVQVISAQKGKHAFACENLNGLLADRLNPLDPSQAEDPNGPPFRPGDKVVRLKNSTVDELIPRKPGGFNPDWFWGDRGYDIGDTAVVNGDLGQIEAIATDRDGKSWILVAFRDPDRFVRLPYSDHNLIRAYAMTVHKCQGSGWPVVIVPVHTAFYWDSRTGTGLWSRELVYTAISRAEKALITVGQWGAIAAAISRKTVHQRRTRLADLLARAIRGEPIRPAIIGPSHAGQAATLAIKDDSYYDFSDMMAEA